MINNICISGKWGGFLPKEPVNIPMLPLMCIVGKNGCGKSEFLVRLYSLCHKTDSPSRMYVSDYGDKNVTVSPPNHTDDSQFIRFSVSADNVEHVFSKLTIGKKYLLLIDDIEHGLHPSIQIDLVNKIKDCQRINPLVQVVMATHSAILLNELKYDQIIVIQKNEGHHYIKLLSEHEEAEECYMTAKAGEFWSVVGDEWCNKPKETK